MLGYTQYIKAWIKQQADTAKYMSIFARKWCIKCPFKLWCKHYDQPLCMKKVNKK